MDEIVVVCDNVIRKFGFLTNKVGVVKKVAEGGVVFVKFDTNIDVSNHIGEINKNGKRKYVVEEPDWVPLKIKETRSPEQSELYSYVNSIHKQPKDTINENTNTIEEQNKLYCSDDKNLIITSNHIVNEETCVVSDVRLVFFVMGRLASGTDSGTRTGYITSKL